ncbi:uncharacterized protein LOC115924819 [Strongylocentrotus purpuratus]|uniref:CCHC-type domain-containing protein n=1 Tax=Strongylocentrotus purpuratus TaxID=7668 RepID=A0A7M7NZ27_STRPU|nr:uncharacterized protein LOC115924819 [Strongylocentrotus purpuratus]
MDEWQDLGDGERRKRIREALRPPASSIISDLRRELPHADSYEYLKALDLAYGDTNTDDELFVKFHNTTQLEGERPSDYLSRLQEILRQVVRRGVVKPTDSNQLLSSVRKQEEEDSMKASLTRPRQRVDAGKRAAAHNRVEAPVQPVQISRTSIPSESTPIQQTPHRPPPPRPHGNTSEVICFKCGEVGHISRICNSPAAPEAINKKLIQFILGKQGNAKGRLVRGDQEST